MLMFAVSAGALGWGAYTGPFMWLGFFKRWSLSWEKGQAFYKVQGEAARVQAG